MDTLGKFLIDMLITFFVFLTGIYIGLEETDIEDMKQIGAMEVYRGNTKLQYIIVDSVKVDSCVIFLNK